MISDTLYPDVARRMAERNELTRQAAQRCIDKHARGEKVHVGTLRWAQQFVAMVKPLGTPLGTREPGAEASS